jgi:cysteine synthase A
MPAVTPRACPGRSAAWNGALLNRDPSDSSAKLDPDLRRNASHCAASGERRLVRPRAVLYGPLPFSTVPAMQIRNGIVEAIGNTPLIKLERASERTGCTILGKAEFMNPGQSVKDRAALFIIEDAVKRGTLKPGGIIVEGTAGNTGIGLALVANALGYRTVIVIPDTQSQEKKDTLRLCGAELIEVPAVPYSNPNNYVKVSGRLAEQLNKSEPQGAIWANQFDNVANRQGHVETTGPEIWAQTDGKVDGFVCAVGTGGTLAGVGIALKDRKPAVKIALADPLGAALYSYYTRGELKSEGSSITEGIGQGRITKNLEDAPIDLAYQVPDEEAVPIIFDLLEQEGLCLGGSSGINVAGAMRLAKDMGRGHVIVTVLADYGTRYQSKLFNPEFLRSKNLPVPGWLERHPNIKVPFQ